VDNGIKETLVGLTVHDINTSGSCEGHIDRGTLAPYVDIETKEAAELYQKAKEMSDEEAKESILKEIKYKNLEERKKLLTLLEDFYDERHVPLHQMLMIESYGHKRGRLQSQGADLQKIEDSETQQQRLREYQEEMNAFSEYLKQGFLVPKTDA
jgi:uncharacterized protein (UPF0248 family)